jgi:hypothetical protein
LDIAEVEVELHIEVVHDVEQYGEPPVMVKSPLSGFFLTC